MFLGWNTPALSSEVRSAVYGCTLGLAGYDAPPFSTRSCQLENDYELTASVRLCGLDEYPRKCLRAGQTRIDFHYVCRSARHGSLRPRIADRPNQACIMGPSIACFRPIATTIYSRPPTSCVTLQLCFHFSQGRVTSTKGYVQP